jgi:hypothetical protein
MATNLIFLGRPIFCEESNRDPNPYHLRVLEKEENDRQAKSDITNTVTRNEAPDALPISFECASVSCGVWRYVVMDPWPSPKRTYSEWVSANE